MEVLLAVCCRTSWKDGLTSPLSASQQPGTLSGRDCFVPDRIITGEGDVLEEGENVQVMS